MKELPRCGILDESVMEEVEELTKAPPTTLPSYLDHPYVLSFRASSFAKWKWFASAMTAAEHALAVRKERSICMFRI